MAQPSPRPAFLVRAGSEQAIREELFRQSKLKRALIARESLADFFELVMRSEKTQGALKVAPHQRVVFDFLTRYKRAVQILPVRHSKSFMSTALALWLLGNDPSSRGAIVSATQGQAAKILSLVASMIEQASLDSTHPLGLVFPGLRQPLRLADAWTQTSITVDRPRGIRDPSLRAVGFGGDLPGSRLDFVLVDDLLSFENTNTRDSRDKVFEWLDNTVLSRLEPGPDSRAVITNTPYHPDDAIHRLEKKGWATIRMSIEGDIHVQDDADERRESVELGLPWEPWDSEHVVPRSDLPGDYGLRLAAHPPGTPLWPEVFPPREIERLKRRHLPHEFNRLYRCSAVDDGEAMCKREYVEACMKAARDRNVHTLTRGWSGGGFVVTGVDLAFGMGSHHDLTAFFTFAILPSGHRQILDIETGRMSGPDTVKKLVAKHRAYGGTIVVENNAGQKLLLDFARKLHVDLPIRGHTTGQAKAHPEYGVAAVFIEMSNGAWLIPNDKHGNMEPEVEKFVRACLEYRPEKHTPDQLMAQYFGRELARKWGALAGADASVSGGASAAQSMAANLLAR